MTEIQDLMKAMYAAFNRRDVDGALAWMSEEVDWPKASEGGRVKGKEAIRDYWGRQWAEFDPHVEPLQVKEHGEGTVEVKVRQLVRSLRGEVLSDGVVVHRYRMVDGLIGRMDVSGGEEAFGRSGREEG